MNKEQLPSYEECEESIENKTASKLHIFIQANEPAGIEDSDLFRSQLAELIDETESKIQLLIDDYRRRLKTLHNELAYSTTTQKAKERLLDKCGSYRTFIIELEKIIKK